MIARMNRDSLERLYALTGTAFADGWLVAARLSTGRWMPVRWVQTSADAYQHARDLIDYEEDGWPHPRTAMVVAASGAYWDQLDEATV